MIPSALVPWSVCIRSVSSGRSSGWQHSHMCHIPSTILTTGSLTAMAAGSPGSTVRGVAFENPAGTGASTTSTRQWNVPGVAQLT